METVLGLSVTSNSVGWVLLDGPGVDAATLDHDVFDISVVDDDDNSKYVTAVQGMQAIAATSGYDLKSIGLTWTADAAAAANQLLTALPGLGFEKVVSVRLSEAAATWAHVFGAALGFEKAAVCVVEPSAATVLSVGDGAVRTFATHTRESDDGLSRWLNDGFEANQMDPEYLFLVGSRGDVELISGRLSEALDMSVVTSNEAQLILARGTALMVRSNADTVPVRLCSEPPSTEKLTGVAALGRKPAWFSPSARAAVTLVAGVIALFVLGPMFLGQPESSSSEDQPVSNSSESSVVIQAFPAPPPPLPVKKVIQQRVLPAPVPAVAEVSAPQPTAEPLAVPVAPAAALPAAVPVVDVTEAPSADVPAEFAHLPGQTSEVPAQTSHLPAEGTPHLPGAAPVLAAEGPTAEAAPAPTPTQAASGSLFSALP